MNLCDDESALAKLPFDSVSPAVTGFGVISGLMNLSKLHSVLPNCGSFLASSLDESKDVDASEPLSLETSVTGAGGGSTIGCVGAFCSTGCVVDVALLVVFSLSSLSSDKSRSCSSSLRIQYGEKNC